MTDPEEDAEAARRRKALKRLLHDARTDREDHEELRAGASDDGARAIARDGVTTGADAAAGAPPGDPDGASDDGAHVIAGDSIVTSTDAPAEARPSGDPDGAASGAEPPHAELGHETFRSLPDKRAARARDRRARTAKHAGIVGSRRDGRVFPPRATHRVDVPDNMNLHNAFFNAWDTITIEPGVVLGHEVMFLTGDHELTPDGVGKGGRSGPIHVERGAWIGSRALILGGVRIGALSVVGAGAVVTKDVPPNELWAGNPAKFIRAARPTSEPGAEPAPA